MNPNRWVGEMSVNILLTCVGSQVAPSVIRLFKNHPNYTVNIIGVDNNDGIDSIGSDFVDKYYQVPMGNTAEYINFIRKIVQKNQIQAIFIGSDEEVIALSSFKNEFVHNYNCQICCPESHTVKLCTDKYDLMIHLKKKGIPVADVYAPKSIEDLKNFATLLGYPQRKFIIKPRFGRGSKGFRVVCHEYDKYDAFINNDIMHISLDDLINIFQQNKNKLTEYLIMEYLPGNKFSSDILLERGKLISMVTRNNWEKPKINPPTQLADIVFNDDVYHYCKQVTEILNFDYFVQIETGIHDDGKPRLIEINTRLDATLPITLGLGLNFYHELVTYAIEGEMRLDINYTKDSVKKIRFVRYWDHLFKDIIEEIN